MARQATQNVTPIPASMLSSAPKLHALHARLQLPTSFPAGTLARALLDSSAETVHPTNGGLAAFGNTLLGLYVGEWLSCRYPRLPKPVMKAAMVGYAGPRALGAVGREWGVEIAQPGDEELGKLQYMPMRQHADHAFGNFVRAVCAGMYIHAGTTAARHFVHAHTLSRHLQLPALFNFKDATRELARLCAREGFEEPVSRLISETGRLSRAPVYVVGAYSGAHKMGEGAGSGLQEAKTRASTNALLAWYLYENKDYTLPSTRMDAPEAPYTPTHLGPGAVIV